MQEGTFSYCYYSLTWHSTNSARVTTISIILHPHFLINCYVAPIVAIIVQSLILYVHHVALVSLFSTRSRVGVARQMLKKLVPYHDRNCRDFGAKNWENYTLQPCQFRAAELAFPWLSKSLAFCGGSEASNEGFGGAIVGQTKDSSSSALADA